MEHHLADLDTGGCMVIGLITKKYYGGWINLVEGREQKWTAVKVKMHLWVP